MSPPPLCPKLSAHYNEYEFKSLSSNYLGTEYLLLSLNFYKDTHDMYTQARKYFRPNDYRIN